MEKRTVYQKIWNELSSSKSMILMSGPRQAGKTTFAKIISDSFTNSVYFNWDIPDDRTKFINNPAFFESVDRKDNSRPIIVLDEIHKYRDWKNYLKGTFDRFHEDYVFLVTGSGRLDLYQRGGDSLAGRYYQLHLWPFTLSELAGNNRLFSEFISNPIRVKDDLNVEKFVDIWKNLSSLSGFPEPFLSSKKTNYTRWSNTYSKQLIREDIRDFTGVRSASDMETLYMLLPSKVGSPTSITSLANDLKVAYNSVSNWLKIFESFYLTFSISPWTRKISRAIHKEKKTYLWDSPRIKDEAARFENMVALELYRAVTSWTDMGYGNFKLHYIKTKEQKEVDFLISDDNEPVLMVEAKLSDSTPSKHLKAFQSNLNIPAVQLTCEGSSYKIVSNGDNKILIAPACMWLPGLP